MTDGRTDRQTDGRTDGRTDRILIARPRLHYMQCGKNPTMLSRVIAKNIGDVFIETQCILVKYNYNYNEKVSKNDNYNYIRKLITTTFSLVSSLASIVPVLD